MAASLAWPSRAFTLTLRSRGAAHHRPLTIDDFKQIEMSAEAMCKEAVHGFAFVQSAYLTAVSQTTGVCLAIASSGWVAKVSPNLPRLQQLAPPPVAVWALRAQRLGKVPMRARLRLDFPKEKPPHRVGVGAWGAKRSSRG